MVAKSFRRAFTLIELLVVVSIIVVLLALLAPLLQKSREVARRVLCSANMRTIGQAAWVFANQRGGRGPGYAYRSPDGSGIGWAAILNQEYFKENRIVTSWSTVTLDALVQGAAPKNKLCCPCMMNWGNQNLLNSLYSWNGVAAGAGAAGMAPTGISIPVAQEQPYWPNTPLNSYTLGAILESFPRAGTKFLMVESETTSGGTFQCCKQIAPYAVTLATPSSSYPPWSGEDNNGAWAFRHVLPPDTSLYQQQATGNVLYVDTHVELLSPNDNIQSVDRTSLQ